ncbi:high-affinity Fe2+/Pb2+ permease [Leifsonia psychrotolerans]|uniref:High-affinity Fe2+/Pb2+ permease n=1 Tax=Glaciibacter psychrotolerans TaxID=670054 RepID=A0A7Z0EFK8_9MICO|nr:hypothetical protein [Leifsonia psychrotolerans]NYJ20608.1 high-affinity Fe2+/Pb2+ permease [Leifsonia psychrotolerans]
MGSFTRAPLVMALQSAAPAEADCFRSAILISDGIGSAVSIALTAIVFVGLAPFGGVWQFVGCFALAAAIGLFAVVTRGRTSVASPAA